MADFDAFADMWADAEMLKDLPFEPQTRAQCWPRFLRLAGNWTLLGYGAWLVFEKTGDFVGVIGFMDGMRGLGSDFDDHRELAYVLRPVHSNKGYATEACHGALEWFDRQRFGDRTVCMIGADHVASIRVAEKCGYELLREATDEHEHGAIRLMTRKNTVLT
jgi:RimJ/RimL family protein N-acetyltransferase